jgi:hypothetical protein
VLGVPGVTIVVAPLQADGSRANERLAEQVAAAVVSTLNGPDARPLRAVAWRWDAERGRPVAITTAWPPPRPGTGAPPRRAAGGALLLEGDIERRGAELGLTFQLFDAASGALVWTRRYVHAATDASTLPDEAAREVAGALRELVVLPSAARGTPVP